jgi:drug/metabolite transporter (DMT)-like permease
LRYTAAGFLLAAILAVRGELSVARSRWFGLGLIGLLTICVGNGGVIWAEQWVPSGIAAVTVATVPFWMIALDALGPAGGRLSFGLFVGFGGVILLVWPELRGNDANGHQFLIGIVVLQLGCLGWGLGSALSRRSAGSEPVLSAAAVQMVFGGIFMLAAGTAHGEWAHLAFTKRTVIAELYLTLVGSIVGYTAYTYALGHLPTATVALYAYANPIIAVILGTIWLGEPFGPRVLAASIMVLMGSALVQWQSVAGTKTVAPTTARVTGRSSATTASSPQSAR